MAWENPYQVDRDMNWIKQGNGYAGEKIVEIRTLRIPDASDTMRRFRTCTVFKDCGSFSSIPAQARLFKSENGYIGALVTGKNEGYVKAGRNFFLRQAVVVGLNSLSGKALRMLVGKDDIDMVEIDGMTVGVEK